MPNKVLDVGNCAADHASIAQMIESNFDATVTRVHSGDEAIESLTGERFNLVLVNRLMDRDGASGLEVIKRIKSDAQLEATPVMMITNFEEHQQLAVESGAEPGFGKQALNLPTSIQLLQKYLG